jgi:hypothetical protein
MEEFSGGTQHGEERFTLVVDDRVLQRPHLSALNFYSGSEMSDFNPTVKKGVID